MKAVLSHYNFIPLPKEPREKSGRPGEEAGVIFFGLEMVHYDYQAFLFSALLEARKERWNKITPNEKVEPIYPGISRIDQGGPMYTISGGENRSETFRLDVPMPRVM